MFLNTFIIQASIIIVLVVIFLASVLLNRHIKPPKDVKLPEKCQFCPSKTCVIKLSDVEQKNEELKEYFDNCEETNGNEEKK